MRIRHFQVSVAAWAVCLSFAAEGAAQQMTVQALLERGAFSEAVQRAEGERDNPESTYLAAFAAGRMNDDGRAVAEYNRLRETGDDSWRAIGESGAMLAEGNVDGARQAAERAVAANGENPYAHYQLGTVAHRQNDYAKSAAEFRRAVDLKGDLAYAHYYAGLAQQRLKNIARMSEHFEAFMRLAPEAPERTAVAAILRTMRPGW
jgi:tetratricopeptide (TPR) repeat protein